MEQKPLIGYSRLNNHYYWVTQLCPPLPFLEHKRIPDTNLEEVLHAMFACATHKHANGISEINAAFAEYCMQKTREELKRYTNYYEKR